MPSTSSLLTRLRADYPQFVFQNASVSRWSPQEKTVFFRSTRGSGAITLLHELGHAVKGHYDYHQDIELLRYEREAWTTAQTIASRYGVTIDEVTIEDAMRTYRQWLHDRSRCPDCEHGAAQQVADLAYHCLLCHTKWHVNDARQCGLRRYTKNTPLL